mgnify:CR=1 FL=1
MKSFNESVAAITGAGSGIGQALALNLAAQGAHLAISDINQAGLDATLDLLKDSGVKVTSQILDVSKKEDVAAWAQKVQADHGKVNLIFNNAGVALGATVEGATYEEYEWMMSINFWGVVHGTKAFLPHLIASGEGHVVNLSSLFGLVSMPGQSIYNASKYAVRGLSEALREEMLIAGHNVGVTVVHPGGIKTAIARNSRVSAKEDQAATAKFFDEKLAKMTPERAAEIIVRGIEKDQARVLVGMDAHALHWFAKLSGSRYQDVVAKVSKKVMPPKTQVV